MVVKTIGTPLSQSLQAELPGIAGVPPGRADLLICLPNDGVGHLGDEWRAARSASHGSVNHMTVSAARIPSP